MLSVSSPIAYPPSSSPAPKRAHGRDGAPKNRTKGGFVLDNSDDSDDDLPSEPVAKKRMLGHAAAQNETTSPDTIAIPEIVAAAIVVHPPPPVESSTVPQECNTLYSQATVFRPTSSANPIEAFAQESRTYKAKACNGTASVIRQRRSGPLATYESMVAARSKIKEGRAAREYYGIEIHKLIDAAKKAEEESAAIRKQQLLQPQDPVPSIEPTSRPKRRILLWTEKYRARSFMDLCGDDGANRHALRWLKRWDPIVFPGTTRHRPAVGRRSAHQPGEEEKPHRKILMLTGPPGLGKTTLAHVCARQAGYEVLEINASDDRSRDVVQNRIRTSLGTETVRTVANCKGGDGIQQRIAKPVCVVVDEVDGVVSGSGASGEGGFVKALIDLVLLDQKSSGSGGGATQSSTSSRKRKKQDNFRLRRPLILICNDIYHPSLRPLRQSSLAEIIHVGKASIDAVVGRLAAVFEKEGVPCEKDAARKLCEAAWGMATGIDAKRGTDGSMEGDLRSVMVVGEWVAGRYRAAADGSSRLTRHWIEKNIIQDLAQGSGSARGLGRGSVKDIVGRIFLEGGGFPRQMTHAGDETARSYKHEQPKAQLGFSELQKRHTMERLRQMIETCGETDRVMTDIFSEYPNREYNDDCSLSKPNLAHDWLHFYDTCSSRLFGGQDWELMPYLSQPGLACHHLFASPRRHVETAGYDKQWGAADMAGTTAEAPAPFSGPRANFLAYEAEKETRAQLQALQSLLPPTLGRSFRSPEDMAVDFIPYLAKIVSPDVKPVVVVGSQGFTASVRRETEKAMVRRAAEVLAEVGVTLEKGKVESDSPVSRGPQFVYRLDPDLDTLSMFETATSNLLTAQAPTRYAVRQVLDQELLRTVAIRENAARQARFRAGNPAGASLDDLIAAKSRETGVRIPKSDGASASDVKRDFFGRVIVERPRPVGDASSSNHASHGQRRPSSNEDSAAGSKVWVTYHEGINNAVRKPISLQEFLKGL